ncbi:diguanylate cyclase domain-containing protein [Kushneria marisflavi]|uniref:diguanylate cyclase n=1 Tax=Kushneria marisflavi TaxID=157779 RepID=A0A240UNZ5_9GAMM|nr:diguanylate cyclase [Kushneria marisflavi]ART62793.1 diguanylate cyclase response regulator [Kushneria marisflavi]RKD83799.1 response regulator receiver modulated diguanylate cyclase [Kushneria marisflavi]
MQHWLKDLQRKPKLLLVDDQRINILTLHELFREECDIFMAMNGEQALETCRKSLPDLILLDVHMEGIDGHEVCRRLKKDPETHDIPVIFVTAQGAEEDEVLGLELGAVDFIVKPINPTIVRARVNTHLTLKYQSDLLRSLALLDGLTGVANRRKFDEELGRTWRQSLREKTELSIIMIDIDYFKRYNDHYGHLRGDTCLQSVAGALEAAVNRPYDLLARYGGEEFVCLLPNTHLKGAVVVAERMQACVRALQLEHADSGIGQVVTVSMGVATMTANSTDGAQVLLEAADRQLYKAKQAGRACIRSGI